MATHLDLLDGGKLAYDEAFYARDRADGLFAELKIQTPWRQEQSRLGFFPRLTAWYADSGLTYSYSGVTHHGLPWTPTLTAIRRAVEAAAGAPFNSLLLNRYRDGNDSIGYHADDEPELGVNPVIASLSLGAVRRFVLKHGKSGEKLAFELAHGSLLIMAGACQHHWRHAVPKTKTVVGERINLTFRNIITDSGAV
jgi:alkylated DNA repair dioxygenase AlkB